MSDEDDDVTYTRILGPLDVPPTGGETVARDQPALVWQPKNGPEQVFLAGPTVSSRHATVRREPIGVVIEDEGSLNGTFVNGVRIEQQLLEDGDRVQIGPHLLVFVGAGATPGI